jgi:hypothetical protein
MNSTRTYDVIFESFTERHFIKSFAKKYKGAWDTTFLFLIQEFTHIDALFLKNTAETIIDSKDIKICKTEFKIAGTPESRHGSGNRCIVAIHKDTSKVCVLLVYGKTDIAGSKETVQWKELIKENYSQYRNLFN